MKTALLYARIQFLRVFRDPITLIVLFSIPLILLLVFGSFTTRDTDDISLKVAVINNSNEEFAAQFKRNIDQVKVLNQPETTASLNGAKELMKSGQIDGIIELPKEFGKTNENGVPSGRVNVVVDQSDLSTGDILMGVMGGIAESTNAALGSQPPIQLEQQSIRGTNARMFDNFYAMFTAMAIMMVGIFGVASAIPADKKSGVLRRMRVTPLRSSQMITGLVLAYFIVTVLSVVMMTAFAGLVFNMKIQGSIFDFGVFVFVGAALMIALGVMVGGWARNTTQSDIYGQIIFLGSLAFSGLWVPRALMPEWLQGITTYLPLTPLIEGMQRIVTEGADLASLGLQLAIMGAWLVVIFLISIKTFRWE